MRWWCLFVLAAIFWIRVGAQLIQHQTTVGWLPEFSAWQSGAVSYRSLLLSQIVIVLLQVGVLIAARADRFAGPRWLRLAILVLGAAYLGFMTFRLVAGQTFLDGHAWFDVPLPSLFHIVLAGFVIISGLALRTTHRHPSDPTVPA